jgi:hypothetical protein
MSTLETHVDVEEIQTTKSEKLLAVVLAAFLLVGGLWAYQKIDDTIRAAVAPPALSQDDRAAVDRLQTATENAARAENRERRALADMEIAREAYRTALDADQPATQLELRYEDAQVAHEQAGVALAAARAEVLAAGPSAAAARDRISAAQRRAARTESLGSFAGRLVLVLVAMVAAFALLRSLRARESRYLPLGLASVGFAAVLAFVMAGDYVTDYVDPLEFGPLVLAAAGIALTLLAFVALERYLERRIPARRVRKDECPFCGFPGRRGGHCEGCGRALEVECGSCSGLRRVGAPHCGACGSA